MSGRGAQREDFVSSPDDARPQVKGLWTRLHSHASGRRSGDQFNVYICDRFVVPGLTTEQQYQIGAGTLLLDQMTRQFIHDQLTYRYAVLADDAQALALEREIRAGSLEPGRPFLNPPLS
jgi:hypothetical protein